MLECFNENLCFYLSLGPWDDFRSCLDLQDWQRWDLCLKNYFILLSDESQVLGRLSII